MATFISVQVFLTTNYNDREECCTHKDPVPYVMNTCYPYYGLIYVLENKKNTNVELN